MARKVKVYFNGDVELDRVQNMRRREYEQRNADPCSFPADLGSWEDRVQVGFIPRPPFGQEITIEHLRPLLATRMVQRVTSEKPHVCDWRCMGAKHGTECKCECGGKNHGINGPDSGGV